MPMKFGMMYDMRKHRPRKSIFKRFKQTPISHFKIAACRFMGMHGETQSQLMHDHVDRKILSSGYVSKKKERKTSRYGL